MKEISRISPPQLDHRSGNSSPTRAMSFAHTIRDVSCERSFSPESQQSPAACESLCFPMFPIANAVTVRRSG